MKLKHAGLLALALLAAGFVACGDSAPNGDSWERAETLESVIDSSTVIVRGTFRGGNTEIPVLLDGDVPVGRENVVNDSFATGHVYRGERPADHFVVPTVVKRRLFEPSPGERAEAVFDAPEFEAGAEYILFLHQPYAGFPGTFAYATAVAGAKVEDGRIKFVAPASYREKFGDEALGPSFDVTEEQLEAAIETAEALARRLNAGQAACGGELLTAAVEQVRLFGSPACVAWNPGSPPAELFAIVVHYKGSGEYFRYELDGGKRALELPSYRQPTCSRGNFVVYVRAMRNLQDEAVGSVAGSAC